MAYEPDKDRLIETLLDGGDEGVTVAVMQYAGGQKKIQISRTVGGRFAKLGRLTVEEAEEVAEAILGYVQRG
ncbi:MAG: hypothetical protein GTN70_04235 [Deltaproteobacteria bacterium]|nr:hypothetical protein [Deltaproteobacteria bacterium]NIS76878.1 hypothetical protein [Deltaproteobacteria bacterium]